MPAIENAPLLPDWTPLKTERREKLLLVTPEMFVLMCKQVGKRTIQITENRLPEDAQCVGVVHDWERNRFGIVVQSSEFPVIGEFDKLEILPPVCFHSAQEAE